MANVKSVSKFVTEYGTPAAIVAGAFILSLSLMTSANLIVRALNSNADQAAVSGVIQTTGAQNTAANPSANNPEAAQAPVNLKSRTSAAAEGNSAAKVTIVEFSDFQCVFCQKFFSESYKQLKSKYIDTGKVSFVYRHFPLSSIHPYAQKAAEAAECAGKQQKFWPYHDQLFTSSSADVQALAVDALKQYAKKLGLNQTQFNSCLDTGASAEAVNQDKNDAAAAGITGTPTFIINGKKFVGALSFSAFESIIEQELKK